MLLNQRLSADFVHGQMTSGGRFRVLIGIDHLTRQYVDRCKTRLSPVSPRCARVAELIERDAKGGMAREMGIECHYIASGRGGQCRMG